MAINEKDLAGVVMLPPYIFMLILGAAFVLQLLVPIDFLQAFRAQEWQFWVGVALSISAVGLAGFGALEFWRNGTNIPPDKPAIRLVTSGAYRFTRNPMYIGFLLLLPAIGLIFSLEWALLLWPALALALHYGVVKREEAYLTGKFGASYREYLGRTRRWL